MNKRKKHRQELATRKKQTKYNEEDAFYRIIDDGFDGAWRYVLRDKSEIYDAVMDKREGYLGK
ncbi:MAG: hypothetical protein GEU26_19460 [Nitrososphaeraceae archaeon]|nr:hypothetical protein [Nitrososphaeraceae archaeon]